MKDKKGEDIHEERWTHPRSRVAEVEERVEHRKTERKDKTDEPDANRHHCKPEGARSAIE
jgi:hypothetical protein